MISPFREGFIFKFLEGFIFKFLENIILTKMFYFTVTSFFNSLLGIELHGGSVGPSLTEYPLQLTMEDDNGGYFKPGFPFRGRVSKCTKMQPCSLNQNEICMGEHVQDYS